VARKDDYEPREAPRDGRTKDAEPLRTGGRRATVGGDPVDSLLRPGQRRRREVLNSGDQRAGHGEREEAPVGGSSVTMTDIVVVPFPV
jgi:hypothetical protein